MAAILTCHSKHNVWQLLDVSLSQVFLYTLANFNIDYIIVSLYKKTIQGLTT